MSSIGQHLITSNNMRLLFLLLFSFALITGCSTNPPKETHNNICDIYDHDDDWKDAAHKSAKKWGTPEYILMAFVHQESRFKHDAQPSREYALGFIPLPRSSSAYGYAQAQNPAWHDYQKATKNRSARRTNIYDAMDFIGWYNYQSYKRNRISRKDTYNLYLAYHEGHGGYSRKTYRNKQWLLDVAKKVSKRSQRYKRQLWSCGSKSKTKPAGTQKQKSKGCNAPWPYC